MLHKTEIWHNKQKKENVQVLWNETNDFDPILHENYIYSILLLF